MRPVKKFLELAKGNARAVRKAVRDSREVALIAAGLLARHIRPDDEGLPLGRWFPLEQRPAEVGEVATICVASPPDGHYMHTFFDVDPISPSGRYLLLTRVPFISRLPYVGDVCQVCVVDLVEHRYRSIYNSRGWGTQLGANAQWGDDDDTVFCNDIGSSGRGTGIRIDARTLEAFELDGPIYGLSPDKRFSYSGSIDLINLSQTGYGVPERVLRRIKPEQNYEQSEGVWKTDLHSGQSTLLLSLADIRKSLPRQGGLSSGDYFIQNVKVSPRNDRLLIVVFSRNVQGRLGWPTQVITCQLDGSDIALAVHDDLYRKGGHHPNWHPSEPRIVMNLRPDGKTMRFCSFNADGTDLRLLDPAAVGGGHPSVRGELLLTDAYVTEGFSDSKGRVPIRLINLASGVETELCRLYTNNLTGGRRVDPHPVWSRDSRVVFNGVVDGRRQVFIARVKASSVE